MHRLRRPLKDHSHLLAHRAEVAIALTLALAQIVPGDEDRRTDVETWKSSEAPPRGVAGSTVGIVGMGRLGQHIALRLAAFEADVVYTDSARAPLTVESRLNVWYVTEPEFWDSADHIIVADARAATAGPLIRRETLAQMRSNASIVNVAGEAVVELAAVSDALNRGLLRGYAAGRC